MATGSTTRRMNPHSSWVSYVAFTCTRHACTEMNVVNVQYRRAASVVEPDTSGRGNVANNSAMHVNKIEWLLRCAP